MARSAELRIGTAGWSIPREFADAVPGEGKHLDRYARAFACSEINSSFHRRHSEKTWSRWRDSVPAGFKFAVKAPKTITHESKLQEANELLREFFADISVLGEALGPVLFQLPPKLAFDSRIADEFFRRLRELFAGDIVCEPRHASWFQVDADRSMRTHKVSRVAADPARVPLAAHPGGSYGLRYYRLHGSPRMYYSAYTSEYLRKLALEITNENSRTWCIFDNTASGAALGNALEVQRLCRELRDAK